MEKHNRVRQSLAFVLAVVMLLSLSSPVLAAEYDDTDTALEVVDEAQNSIQPMAASGTYTIVRNQADLDDMRNDLSGSYILMDDIELEGTWTPIGSGNSSSDAFTGEFINGGDYVISGLKVEATRNYGGLFGVLRGGAVIEGINIELDSITQGRYSGGLAGLAYATGGDITIKNVTVSGGTIENWDDEDDDDDDKDDDDKDDDDDDGSAEAGSYAGGLLGATRSSGSSNSVVIESSKVLDTDIVAGQYGGGFVGRMRGNTTAKNSYAIGGTVTLSRQYGGGFAGRMSSNARAVNCFAQVDVFTTRTGTYVYVGGFTGRMSGNASAKNCYTTGSVTRVNYRSGGTRGMGGFTGRQSSSTSVVNCYSTGTVNPNSSSAAWVGLFVGRRTANATIQNCVYDVTTSSAHVSSAIGSGTGGSPTVTGLTTTEMISGDNLPSAWGVRDNTDGVSAGLANDDYPWYIDEDCTYPYLYYQYDGWGARAVNYKLGAVTYVNGDALRQKRADFTIGGDTPFKVTSVGAIYAYFPYDGTSMYKLDAKRGTETEVPKGTYYSAVQQSLGGVSAMGIIAFTSGPSQKVVAEDSAGVNGEQVYPGDTITYEIIYTNNTDYTAAVTITDELNEAVEYVNHTDENDVEQDGVGYDLSTHTVEWRITDIPAGDAGVVTVTVRVRDDVLDLLQPGDDDVVWLSNGATLVWDGDVRADEEPETENPVADKSKKYVSSETGKGGQPVTVGDQITYTISYVNNSDADRELVITDGLHEAVDYVNHTNPSGTQMNGTGYYADTHTVIWDIGTVQAGKGGTVTLTVRVNDKLAEINQTGDEPLVLTNQATLVWDGDEEEPEEPEVVNPVGSYKIVSSASEAGVGGAPVIVGDEITYEIAYINTTGHEADVTIVDEIPDGAEYVDHTGPGVWNERDNCVIWEIEGVAPNTKGTVTVTVRITEDAGESVVNTADITWAHEDGSTTEEPQVENPIAASKVVAGDSESGKNGQPVTIGDQITYEISFVNLYDQTQDLVIVDELPKTLKYVGHTDLISSGDVDPRCTSRVIPDPATGTVSVEWTITGLVPGERGTVSITVEVTDEIKNGTDLQIVNRAGLEWSKSEDEYEPETPLPVGSYKVVANGSAGADGQVIHVGDRITYDIVYINNTDETADVKIVDELAPGLEYVDSTDGEALVGSPGTTQSRGFDATDRVVTWKIEDIPAGSAGKVTVTVEVTDQVGDEVTNAAVLTWDDGSGGEPGEPEEPGVTNPVGSRKYVQDGSAGAGGTRVTPGDYVTYAIEFYNSSDVYADLVIVDELTAGLIYQSATPAVLSDGGTVTSSYTEDNNRVTWQVENLRPGARGYVTVTALVTEDAESVILNEAELTWAGLDGGEGPGPEEPNVPVELSSYKYVPEASVAGAGGAAVNPGDEMTYEVVYINHTGQKAELTVVDTLPEDVTLVPAKTTPGYTEGTDGNGRVTLTWVIPVPVDERGKVEITVTVNDDAEEDLINEAELTWDIEDGEPDIEEPSTVNPVGGYQVIYYPNHGDATGAKVFKVELDQDHEILGNTDLDEDFVREHYTFLGWSRNPAATEPDAGLAPGETIRDTGTVELYAVWRVNEYTVVYDANNGSGETEPFTQPVLEDHEVRGAELFSYPGYVLTGWEDESGAPISIGDFIKATGTDGETFTLKAVWETDPGYTYDVVYYANNDEEPEPTHTVAQYALEDHQVLGNDVTDFSHYGHKFLGWSENRNATTAQYAPGATLAKLPAGERVALYAVWDEDETQTYNVVYHANNGVTPEETYPVTEQVLGDHIALSNDETKFSHYGYAFAGWALDKDSAVADYQPSARVPRAGIDETIDLYAVWTVDSGQTYDVVYHANNGGTATYTVTEQALTDHIAVTLETTGFSYYGYEFAGWSTASTATSAQYGPGANVGRAQAGDVLDLYAVWTTDSSQTYSVVYHANNGGTATYTATEQVLSDHTAVSLATTGFSNYGYTFLGWSDSANATTARYQPGDTVDRVALGETINLYAVWTVDSSQTYRVVYHANNGASPEETYTVTEQVLTDHQALSNSTTGFSHYGYAFLGWSTRANATTAQYAPGSNVGSTSQGGTINLYAVWETDSSLTYDVVYYANNGETPEPTHKVSVQVLTAHTALNNRVTGFTRDGYEFVGWSRDDNATTAQYSAGDSVGRAEAGETIELYAVWERAELDEFTVTFYYNTEYFDGSVYETVVVTEGDRVSRPDDPADISVGLDETDENVIWMSFAAWYTEADCINAYDFGSAVTGNLSLYADWDPYLVPAEMPEIERENHFAYLVGYEDDTVRPNENIRRGETATIFFRIITDESRELYWATSNNFADVATGDWYNNAISTAYRAGLVKGHSATEFAPEDYITRAEFAALAARFTGVTSYTGESVFSDVDPDEWYWEEVHIAYETGWIQGDADSDKFRPDEHITRAEVASLVNRMRENLPETTSDLLFDMITWPDNVVSDWWYYDIQEATNSHYFDLKLDENGEPTGHETWTGLRDNRKWEVLQNEDATATSLYAGETWNERSPDYIAES